MYKYGWIPDLPDHRDHVYSFKYTGSLPAQIDLRPQCPKEIYDQGNLSSCTGNAIAGAIEFEQLKQKLFSFIPSRLFIYYNERVIEHTVYSDCGAFIRDGIKTVNRDGVPPEIIWPYIESKVTIKPSQNAYQSARQHLVLKYSRILRDLTHLKSCLASGFPFIFGFTVYESFESEEVAKTGIVSLPQENEKVVGGHAVLAVGYDDSTQIFIIRNSWGAKWGLGGYFTLPYEYLINENLSDDFWTIQFIK